MHPQIKSDKKGLCPICGMELIPVYQSAGNNESGDWELALSHRARKLMSVETARVKKQDAYYTFNVFGTIASSEKKEFVLTSWFGGRIDKLYYEVKGEYLKKGAKIADIYSPEIYKAEKELIEASKSVKSSEVDVEKYARLRFNAAKKKLTLLGLNDFQIKKILQKAEPEEHISVYAEYSGYIIDKRVTEGVYVKKGASLYKLAELKKLWVFFDIYESDLMWIKKGEKVKFVSDSFPGKVFWGKITFINPTVDSKTRTIKIRADINNSDGLLKPQMFVKGVVFSKIGTKAYLSGETEEKPLIIPLSAPLITGERAVVYVEKEEGIFEGREVVLGPKTDKGYVVLKGLKEGDKVVIKGNFLIDSELQIRGKKSMMYQNGEAPPAHNHGKILSGAKKDKVIVFKTSGEFEKSASFLIDDYLEIQRALSRDNLKAAKKIALSTLKKLKKVKMKVLSPSSHKEWMKLQREMEKNLKKISQLDSIENARKFFYSFSLSVEKAIKEFKLNKHTIYKYFCPMAFDNKGAYWFQDKEGTANPYFGSKMFKCGSEIEKLLPKDNGDSK